jgi:hypothetical protein
VEFGTFDAADYADELQRASDNRQVGTKLLFENERVRIWDLDLAPGERAAFHCHSRPYFFVCVDAGQSMTRFADGTTVTVEYTEGDTWYDELADGPHVHDLENVGSTRLRFSTVELLS